MPSVIGHIYKPLQISLLIKLASVVPSHLFRMPQSHFSLNLYLYLSLQTYNLSFLFAYMPAQLELVVCRPVV